MKYNYSLSQLQLVISLYRFRVSVEGTSGRQELGDIHIPKLILHGVLTPNEAEAHSFWYQDPLAEAQR